VFDRGLAVVYSLISHRISVSLARISLQHRSVDQWAAVDDKRTNTAISLLRAQGWRE